jgi:hypothetical protein
MTHIAAYAVALAAAAAWAQMPPSELSFPIGQKNGSGETGTVTLTSRAGGSTLVVISLQGAPQGADKAQPAHVHAGTCANLNAAPKYPLDNVLDGKSSTVLPVSIDTLMADTHAINVHKSMSDLKTYVACADLKRAA